LSIGIALNEIQKKQKDIAQANLGKGVFEGPTGLRTTGRTQKYAKQHQQKCAPTAWNIMRPKVWPRARRLAIEKGNATPARNENDG